ncbi:MAG TPA: universal stress protein [Ktedonobacterales bacterium]
MFNHIVVPLDGSERAEQALPIAARIASKGGGVVTLLRVVDVQEWYGPYFVPTGGGMMPSGGWTPSSGMNEGREVAEAYLKGMAASPTLLAVQTSVMVRDGAAAHVILEEIELQHADLVVMGSHGRTGLSRWALGSVAEHVARHATVPVLILHENSSPLIDLSQPLRMLVPLDGSARARAALAPAIELLISLRAPASAEMHLVMVVAPYVVEETDSSYTLMLEGARSYLTGVAEDVRQEAAGRIPLSVTWSVATDNDFADGIIQVAENRRSIEGAQSTEGPGSFDLIAMATHGRTGIARWALGSVGEHVFHGTRLPFLIVRPQEIAEQQRGFPAQTTATNA